MILDACSLLLVGLESAAGPLPRRQALLTFAVARHAVGDLSQTTNAPPRAPDPDRLPPAALTRLRTELAEAGLTLRTGESANRALAELRALYEPYVAAMAERLRYDLPPWSPSTAAEDDWMTTAWQTDPAVALRAVGWDTAQGNGRHGLE
jgi:hypothetical protein